MQKSHPDSHELDDWPLYGPKDLEVALLVGGFADVHGLRIREIENLLIAALRQRLTEAEQDGKG